MADDLELELDLDSENINRTEERIKNLSSKVKEQAGKADEERKAREESDARAEAAEKRAEFLENFSEVATKYPGANDFKTQIEERVQKGYTVEDAAVAVLASEGKFTPPEVPVVVEPAAGGSAVTSVGNAPKPLEDMSQADRRAKLLEADTNGELSQILARGL